MSFASPGGETGVVHKSAHPSLPPAAPQQVVQYLLAKNFHLTALELLVEAQQSGHGDDVRDLEAFFSDPERFPPEELARHQPAHVFDLQAAGRERESRLQMAEYELRLAKEDLAEMARKLAQAQERQQQPQQLQQQQSSSSAPGPSAAGSGVTSPAARVTGSSAPPEGGVVPDSAPGDSQASAGGDPDHRPLGTVSRGLSSGLPTPAEQRAINAAVFAHLLRLGLVTTAMTMEEEYGGPLRPAAQSPHGSGQEAEPWELWSWYHSAAQAAARDAAAAAAAQSGPGTLTGDSGPAAATATLLELASDFDASSDPTFTDADSLSATSAEELRQLLLESYRQVAETRDKARVALHAAQKQLAALRALGATTASAAVSPPAAGTPAALPSPQRGTLPSPQRGTLPSPQRGTLPSPQPPLLAEDAAVLDLLDLGSSVTSSLLLDAVSSTAGPAAAGLPSTPSTLAATAAGTPSMAALPLSPAVDSPDTGRVPGSPARSQAAAAAAAVAAGLVRPPWLRDIDPDQHAALQGLLGRLCEALPRLVPNLNIKSRVDALPLLVAAAKTTNEWPVRQQLLAAVFNLVPTPDHQQRQAIIESCLELCRAFGSSWAASELVQLCARQTSSPSSERRTLVAEALGAAVGVVDAGTQAHVLLTQLTQLAKDRLEQVREAACHSLARLVPRLPFSRSYYTPLEALLMPLAMDGSEAVHSAALSYLVPALLTWQPQDTDSLLVSSCLARVLSEISSQVRIIEQQQQQLQKAALAAASASAAATTTTTPADAPTSATHPPAAGGSSSGGGGNSTFGGTFLRYTLPASNQAAPDAAGAQHGDQQPLAPQPSPPSQTALPPPPAQPVPFGRRTFPSLSHLALYQLLGLYCGLAPALRHAALRSKPFWAGGPPFAAAADGALGATHSSPAAAAAAAGSRAPHHHRAGSYGTSGAPLAASAAATHHHQLDGTPGRVSSTSSSGAVRGSATAAASPSRGPSHRRTSSHPATLGAEAGALASGAAGSPLVHGSRSSVGFGGLTLPPHDRLPPVPPTPPDGAGVSSGSAIGDTLLLLSDGDPTATAVTGAEAAAGERSPGAGSPLRSRAQGSEGEASDGGPEETEAEAEGSDPEWAEQDAALAAWATQPLHGSWKTLEWVMKYVVPELLRLLGCVGPAVPEAFEVRRQAASAVAATCGALGMPFTSSAVLPVFLVAAGTGATSAGTCVTLGDYDAPVAVRDVCTAVQPRTADALRSARQCVLPVLLVAVLPAAAQLRPYLEQLMGSAHELRHRWLLEALQDYAAALTFACNLRPELVPDVLRLFEDLLSGNTAAFRSPAQGAASAADGARPADATGPGEGAPPGGAAAGQSPPASCSGGPASTAVGLCCAALARALVPLATLEMASRRLLPGLMALMSYGEPELQRACVGVLAELGLRFRGDGPRVSEQVLVVFDSLLEQGGHAVQLEVLAAGTALAAAAAPAAAVSAAAAAQVEWLLTAVQAVAMRLATGPSGHPANGGAVTSVSPEQQRAVAAQLLAALRAVAPFDLRLPRLQSTFSAALDAIQRCKTLLPDLQQQAALNTLLKERPTGSSAASASVSSSSSAAGPAANTPPRVPPASHGPYFSTASGQTAAGTATGVPLSAQSPGLPQLGSLLHHSVGTSSSSSPSQAPASASGGAAGADSQGAGGQLRSRFDAFRMRLMKRRDDPAAPQAAAGAAAGVGERPKEAFFSDDEGE